MLSNPRSGHGAHVSPFVSSKQGGKKKKEKSATSIIRDTRDNRARFPARPGKS